VYEKPTSTREVGRAAPWAKFIIFGDTIAPVLSPRSTEKEIDQSIHRIDVGCFRARYTLTRWTTNSPRITITETCSHTQAHA